MAAIMDPQIRSLLQRGIVIPACPLALTAERRFDERRQRALGRYYSAAGAGGLAVGVHTTQFAIREPQIGLFSVVLELMSEEMDRADAGRVEPMVRVAGVCGRTAQAASEASLARDLGYHAGLLSLAAMKDADDDALIDHCRTVAEAIPIFGFYLQPAAGGRLLSYSFWRRLAELPNLVAIKIAPFNRYHTMDVVRAIAEADREDVALYTGNDDNIVMDLLTPYRFTTNGRTIERRMVGGLLGHWAVWTKNAVELLHECHELVESGGVAGPDMLAKAIQVTDVDAALLDAANSFAGCLPGLHEVLRRQGLLAGTWSLDPNEALSPGQVEEIDRVYKAYPHLNDDAFVAENLGKWLSG